MRTAAGARTASLAVVVPGSVALAAALAAAGAAQAQAPSVESVLERAAESVVAVSVDAGERASVGAGLVVGRSGDALLVLTAAHVVPADPARVLVRLKRFADRPLADTTLLQADRKADIALLRVGGLLAAGIDACAVPPLRLDVEMPVQRGHAVYAVGNPAGVAWKVPPASDRVGEVSAREVRFQSTVIQAGHSGGAVFNVFGDLVGMIRADQPPFGVALRVAVLQRALAEWKADTGSAACAPAGAASSAPARATSPFREWAARLASSSEDFEYRLRSSSRATPALRAVFTNDLEALKRAAETPPGLDSDWGLTPLEAAVLMQRRELLRFLLLKGVRLNGFDQTGVPGARADESEEAGGALHMAARLDDVEAIRLLVRAGADLENGAMMNGGPGSPLTVAVRHGSLRAIKELIALGADVMLDKNGWDRDAQAPLLAAIRRDDVGLIRMLRAGGAKLRGGYGNCTSNALLVAAAVQGRLAAMRYLVAEGVSLEPDIGCDGPMREAVWANQVEAIRVLLRAGANPTGGDFEPYLCLAVSMGHREALKALLLGGANPNQGGRDGTPLAIAKRDEKRDMVEILQAHGARR